MTFTEKTAQLTLINDVEKTASTNIKSILDLNIPQETLDSLSDLQCSILFMTILGYSLEQVGRYNGIKQVTVSKEMVGLAKHPAWEQYGIKATPKSRREVRTNRRRN